MLDISGFTVTIGNEMFSLFSKSKVVSTGILIDGLYKLKLHASYFEPLYVNSLGTKRILIKEILRSLVLNGAQESYIWCTQTFAFPTAS